MVEVEVTFDYDAEQIDELSIKVGDIIKNVKMVEGGWWEGELNGKSGMFPDNFVKVIDKTKEKEEPSPKKDLAKRGASVKELANKLKEVPIGTSAPRRKEASVKKKKAKVLFDYEPENEDELKIDTGDILEITKQEEEGWWEGILNGKKGMFPSNFVEEIEETDSDKTDKISEEKPKEPPEGQKKKIIGVGLGNIFAGGPINLRTSSGMKKEKEEAKPPSEENTSVVKREKPAPMSKVTSPINRKATERAIVRYSYAADNEDELSLKENEIITILEKELDDPGWWKGEINGKIGLFPDNFVELLAPEESGSDSTTSRAHNKIPPQPKPKKPPPPTNVKQAPKLPDKAPVSDSARPLPEPIIPEKTSIKKKEIDTGHTDKHPPPEKHAPPAITSKKPSVPPPVGRKPKPVGALEQKIVPPPTSTKEEHKVTPSQSSKDNKKDSEENFEGLEPTTVKLTHLTANRAKGPNKRPPSQQKSIRRPLQEDEKMINGDVKEKEVPVRRPPPPVLKESKEEPPAKPPHSAPARPPEPQIGTANLLSAIEDLKRELRELKANTVSKAAYEELKADNVKIRQELENFRVKQTRKFKDLFEEVDEEKKIRLNTQVEIERIKKLVSESHV